MKSKSLRQLIKELKADERGVTTIEFVIAAVVFMFVLFWTIETGFIMVRWVMLERGVDLAARDLRLNGLPVALQDENGDVPNEVAHNYIRDQICNNTAIIKACNDNLFVELSSVDSVSGTLPSNGVTCRNRLATVNPLTDLPIVNAGERNVLDSTDMMYLRACVVIDPILPANYSMPLPRDESGGVALIVDSAFVNEPE